jgi:hypothetical protein
MGGGSLATDATAGAIPRRRASERGVRCGWLVAWGADTRVEIERDGIKRCQA